MARLIWSEEALEDLENIYDFIARDSPTYARHQIERISRSVERLRIFPLSGRHLPEFPDLPHREIIVGNYRVVYRATGARDRVTIISVVHGARLMRRPET